MNREVENARLMYISASLVLRARRLYGRRDAYGAIITVMDGVNERMWGDASGGQIDLKAVGTRPLGAPTLSSTRPLTNRSPSSPPAVHPQLVPPASLPNANLLFQRSALPRRSLSITSRQAARDRRGRLLPTGKSMVRQRALVKLQTETPASRACSGHTEASAFGHCSSAWSDLRAARVIQFLTSWIIPHGCTLAFMIVQTCLWSRTSKAACKFPGACTGQIVEDSEANVCCGPDLTETKETSYPRRYPVIDAAAAIAFLVASRSASSSSMTARHSMAIKPWFSCSELHTSHLYRTEATSA